MDGPAAQVAVAGSHVSDEFTLINSVQAPGPVRLTQGGVGKRSGLGARPPVTSTFPLGSSVALCR